jgi:hypothetical protein
VLFDGTPRAVAVTGDAVAVGLEDRDGSRLAFLDHRFRPTGMLALPGEIREVCALPQSVGP